MVLGCGDGPVPIARLAGKRPAPSGSDGWGATAVAWLLDLVPEYRQYPVVCRHPLALAYIARYLVHGSVEGARQAYRTVRSELAEDVPPHAADAYQVQGRCLAATERAVELVERALCGERILSGPGPLYRQRPSG